MNERKAFPLKTAHAASISPLIMVMYSCTYFMASPHAAQIAGPAAICGVGVTLKELGSGLRPKETRIPSHFHRTPACFHKTHLPHSFGSAVNHLFRVLTNFPRLFIYTRLSKTPASRGRSSTTTSARGPGDGRRPHAPPA